MHLAQSLIDLERQLKHFELIDCLNQQLKHLLEHQESCEPHYLFQFELCLIDLEFELNLFDFDQLYFVLHSYQLAFELQPHERFEC